MEFFKVIKDIKLKNSQIVAFGSTRKPNSNVNEDINKMCIRDSNQPIYVGNSSVSVDTNNNVVLSSGAVHRFNIVDFQDYNSLNKVG